MPAVLTVEMVGLKITDIGFKHMASYHTANMLYTCRPPEDGAHKSPLDKVQG